MKRPIYRVLFLLAVLVAGATVPLDAQEVQRLPALQSQTGPAAFLGKAVIEALTLVEQMVNAQGGVAGKQIHFAVGDPQSNPSVAIQLATGLKASGAPAIIGPVYTAECNALVPLVQSGPVSYCIASGIHPAPGSFMFSGGTSTVSLATGLLNYFRDMGWHRIAEISSTDASGQDLEASFDEALARPENRGVSVVEREHFALSDIEVGAQVVRIKGSGADATIVWTSGTGFGVALRGIHDAGVGGTIVGGYGNMVHVQLTQYKSFLPPTLLFPGILAMGRATSAPPLVKAAQDRYFRAYTAAGTKPDLPGALAWDPILLVLDAYKARGWNATAEQIRSWIASQRNWSGVNGVYDFVKYPQRGLGPETVVVYRWNDATNDFVPVSKPGGTKL